MKKASIIFTLIILFVGFYSCNNTKTYSELQAEEQALISTYIQRNNIVVVNTMPEIGEWGENEYYKSTSGLYFHLVKATESADTVKTKFRISYRQRLYTLTVPSDTVSNWSTVDYAYPEELVFGDYTTGTAGLQEAVKYMKYLNSEAKIIVPHDISTNSNLLSVTPVAYDLKITAIN